MKKATLWQLASNAIALLLGMGQLAILARLLDVSAFGVIAIVWVVIYISQAVADAGMSNYLIYKQDVTRVVNSTIFWISVGLGLSVSIAIWLCSEMVASVYDQPELGFLIKMTSIHFILIGVSSQLQTRFLKDFKHITLAKIEIVSKAIGIISSIILALFYPQAWVIIAGLIINTACKALLLWVLSNKEWRPTFQFSYSEAKLGFNYGVYQMGGQVLNQVRGNLDTLLLASFLSASSLGIYTLAKSIVVKPSQVVLPAVYKLMLPFIAKHQNNREKLLLSLNQSHYWLAAAMCFIYGTFIVLSSPFIEWFYGVGYEEMQAVFVPLAIFWLLRSVGGAFVGASCQAIGQTKREFNWNIFSFIANTGITAIAAQYGSVTLAWSLVAMQLVVLPVIHRYVFDALFKWDAKYYALPILTSAALSFTLLLSFDWIWRLFVTVDLPFLHVFAVSSASIPIYYLLLCLATRKQGYFPKIQELRAKL